ncbi:MAG: hypothetical protein RLZZ282_47, partial [Verrucomicrobiota bacterium]
IGLLLSRRKNKLVAEYALRGLDPSIAAEKNSEGDNPPIGIILTRNKDEPSHSYS